jgi:hypothetical protein
MVADACGDATTPHIKDHTRSLKSLECRFDVWRVRIAPFAKVAEAEVFVQHRFAMSSSPYPILRRSKWRARCARARVAKML